MGRTTTIGSIVAKAVKIVLIMIILILYRVGHGGKFLGVGGTFNLNEEKAVDVEILASGVFVGFLVYNLSVLITYILTGERLINYVLICVYFLIIDQEWSPDSGHDLGCADLDCIMNVIGIFLWIAVGGTALHYWDSYAKQHEFEVTGDERSSGLALGSLCLINAIVHVVDTVFSIRLYLDKSQ